MLKSLKLKEIHLIESDTNTIQPMVQIFFEDENHFTHAVAMPLTVYNNPSEQMKKGNA